MRIKTERLYMREVNPDDYDALYAVLADADIMQHYLYALMRRKPGLGSYEI